MMAEKMEGRDQSRVWRNKGTCKPVDQIPTRVSMFGSGQWTVFEGYAASKLCKAGFRSNNIDRERASLHGQAVGAFIRAFGADEPMGCL